MSCDTRFTMGWHLRDDAPVWLTIGNFDGVHLGHQALLADLIRLARQDDTRSVLLSFSPNPKVFFSGEKGFYLSTPGEKTALLSRLGIDDVLIIAFERKLANMAATDFMAELTRRINLKGFVVGEDFVFGHNRQGTTEVLAEFCEKQGIPFVVFPELMMDGEPVSSTRIRRALNDGKVDEARRLLGRPYAMCAKVISGEQIGKSIGVPTANLELDPDKFLPKSGVYATIAHLREKDYPAVTNVGVRPTFSEQEIVSVETLILDFNDDIYGEELRVEFIQCLRPEQKFDSVQALTQQIEKDKLITRRIFENGLK
ncbi:MAG TPA: bifunctional riboflavin kinase/FAD synthetase [Anaerolineaceae bacterium]|nr:bifunctional riboflavin kinase/FAD synthetase [Anaerolineaceae bacterium]